MSYFAEVWNASFGLLKGLWVTIVSLFRPAITVQYPTEKLVPYRGFRGALLYDITHCGACGLCAKACPSNCIQFEHAVDEKGKKLRRTEWYSIDFGKCNFCRLCEEACPTKGGPELWHSLDYELVFFSRDDMVRYWQAGFPLVGRQYDKKAKKFVDPPGQVQIQTVQDRWTPETPKPAVAPKPAPKAAPKKEGDAGKEKPKE